MATLKELRDERLRKLTELRQLGLDPYPARSHRTHHAKVILDDFETLHDTEVTVAGRVAGIRKFGALAFIVLRDVSGQIQLFMKADTVEPLKADNGQLGISELPLLDTGDFIEATGPVIRTKTGEVSVDVRQLRLLTKSLRPMPNAVDGFTDKEQRLRRRYVDMNVNLDVRARYERRSRFWSATREFLDGQGFYEVNVPVLEHTTGGADANPFVTHMDALDTDFYLRISHELPLKRLIGGGFEKVYDIGPRFRNENYSDEHLPEHVAMEWYWAYADWRAGMAMQEKLFNHVIERTFGTLQFTIGKFDIDLSKKWEEWDYAEIIKDRYG
ncbi:MAG TPA: amino acid--tRNA ligase-related protein, partial [Candidatus Saccharimonadales bacterium]